ncbi:uncharacterized protein LOC128872737 isoform X2 [Hylaeus volcanicus]|uniref:uncharacterized protein LOC128872737 isoform X2 n=1 Tax=Hylaeus volcanicus TaxID=313075 RepID=UPI0023B79CDE|nr:uncharacterized protein LOC128872737 isoform X2 [Hylaeus volcanicus]
MSDYEMAAVTAVSKLFPNANIHGCWFHYCQAILRKWRKLGLTNAPNSVVRMAMSLSLVPGTKFQEGLVIIQREVDIVLNNFPNVLLFMAYMRTNWLKMASHVSVRNCPVRTNNIAESFHNIAGLKLGKQNINVWTFLDYLWKSYYVVFIMETEFFKLIKLILWQMKILTTRLQMLIILLKQLIVQWKTVNKFVVLYNCREHELPVLENGVNRE